MGFGGLQISVSGLRASKHSLNTVSHNIANANNPHYVRQSALHAETQYKYIGTAGQQGTGVDISQIRQIRDSFLDLQLRKELPKFGYYVSKADALGDVEGLFNEISSSGLQENMNTFWDNWEELYSYPESLTPRGLIHESAVGLTETVNHLSDQLIKVQRNIDREVFEKGNEVNGLLEGIYDLNEMIKLQEAEGNAISSNDLRDERNAILDRLHQILPVKTYEDEHGGVVVHLQGKALVEGTYIGRLDVKPSMDDNSGFYDIYWEGTSDKVKLSGEGELGGYIDARDKSVSKYRNLLDELVGSLAKEINDIHERGYGLNETANGTGPNPNGRPFFVAKNGGKIVAGNIRVNPELADYNKISISENGEKGDGELAKLIAALRTKSDENFLKDPNNNQPVTIDEFYNVIVTELGLERSESIRNSTNQGFLVKSIDEKRSTLSSVSLDEEMADMLRFQYAYTANSRVINTIDEMIETVVTRVGLVGR